MANQNARPVTRGVVNCRKADMALDNSAFPSSRITGSFFFIDGNVAQLLAFQSICKNRADIVPFTILTAL